MIRDKQHRKWMMRFKQYQHGWQWNAEWKSFGLSSGEQLFATKALAEADARRSIQSHDAVAQTQEYFRRLAMRGTECQLTPEDHEAIRQAGAVARPRPAR